MDQEETTGRNPRYARYDSMSLTDLGKAMEEVRRNLDAVKSTATDLEKEYEFIRTVKIPPLMESEGLQNFRLESGKGIRVQDEVFVSLRKEFFGSFKGWLQEQGDEAIIQETINSSTLKAYVTGRIKDGKEYPGDMVSVTIVQKARFF